MVADLLGWQAATRATAAATRSRNTPAAYDFLPTPARVVTMPFMRKQERRRTDRSLASVTQALKYQLAACCEDGRIEAMVVADGDGLPLASSGDTYACDEVAARMVLVGARIKEFNGTLLGSGQRWDVQMLKVEVDGSELLVCAVGGTAEARRRQI